jgi:O-antigen/teichoic acid export membrane protein
MQTPISEIAATAPTSGSAVEKASPRRMDAGALLSGARSLIANTAITSALGLAFWVLAARLFSRETVGRDSVLLSVMVELSAICQLDMQTAILRFLPDLGGLSRVGLACAYGVSGVLALVAGTVFVLVAPDVAGNLGFLRASWGLALAFVGVLVLWGAFVLQDAALTAVRRAKFVAVENGTFGVLKLAALVVLAAVGTSNGVFLAWVLPVAPLIVAVNVYLFGRGLSAHAETHGAQGIGGTVLGRLGMRGAARFLAGDYIAGVLGQASITILPLLAIAIVGAGESAYLAIPLGTALAFDTLASGAGGALVVESTIQRDERTSLIRLFVRRVGGPLFVGAVFLVVAAPIVLQLFGGEYAEHSTPVLRLLIGASAVRVLLSTFTAEARAHGRVGRLVVVQLLILAGVMGTGIPLAEAYGVTGVAAAWLAGNLLGCVYAVPIIVKNLRS